jgi:hypothetical protein
MATYTLTTGTDTIVDTSGNDTVYATAATLNAGDRLTGGGGIDTLALYDTGIFPVDALATFTGCARITSTTIRRASHSSGLATRRSRSSGRR